MMLWRVYQCITVIASLYDSLLIFLKLAVTASSYDSLLISLKLAVTVIREEVHQSVWISNQQSHLIVL